MSIPRLHVLISATLRLAYLFLVAGSRATSLRRGTVIVVCTAALGPLSGCVLVADDWGPPVGLVGDEANPEKAYLVIDAYHVGRNGREPSWIGVTGQDWRFHLPPQVTIVELEPGRYRLHDVHFGNDGVNYAVLWEIRMFGLLPGRVYYYGTIETDKNVRRTAVRTFHDEALHRRACTEAPHVFAAFETELVGPLAETALTLPPCDPPAPPTTQEHVSP